LEQNVFPYKPKTSQCDFLYGFLQIPHACLKLTLGRIPNPAAGVQASTLRFRRTRSTTEVLCRSRTNSDFILINNQGNHGYRSPLGFKSSLNSYRTLHARQAAVDAARKATEAAHMRGSLEMGLTPQLSVSMSVPSRASCSHSRPANSPTEPPLWATHTQLDPPSDPGTVFSSTARRAPFIASLFGFGL
jgi:hypothetical protein